MKHNLFIDDLREQPLEFDLIARDAFEAMKFIDKFDDFGIISFDHDLGIDEDGQEYSGFNVIYHLLEKLFNGEEKNIDEIYVHSDNVNSTSMIKALKQAQKRGIIPKETYIHDRKVNFREKYTFKKD